MCLLYCDCLSTNSTTILTRDFHRVTHPLIDSMLGVLINTFAGTGGDHSYAQASSIDFNLDLSLK